MEWLDELDLRPEATWLSMGTRALGARPWLLADARRDDELRLKSRLRREHHPEVFAASDGSCAAGEEVLDLVAADPAAADPSAVDPPPIHPLDAAGAVVQEDLCLLARADDGWHLVAGSVCFPSRWRLGDKLGRHVTDVHQPVAGYDRSLASRVDRLFDRLGERPVLRRNWFVHPDASLFQPARPRVERVLPAHEALDGLVVRSERQTLRRLPISGAILFTIRTQQAPVTDLVAHPGRRDALRLLLDEAPAGTLAHRGMSPAQVAELRAAIRRLPA